MKLTPEQVEVVRQWAEAGASLNDIQRQLKTELDVGCTYMDLRLTLLDLGIAIAVKPRTPDPVPTPAVPPAAAAAAAPGIAPPEAIPAAGTGSVSVALDQIAVPGTMASGRVTFSDGQVATWYVDEMGRLGMKAPSPGYQPPPQDVEVFQTQLDRVLAQAGF